jgi:hypothetical protein
MRLYAVYINEQALATAPRSGVERDRVMKVIHSLAANPNTAGDFTEKDHAGRTVQVKLIGRYAITYWADHPVSEIKITHIKMADK